MRCLKILRRQPIYSLFAFLFFSFFLSFGLSQDSYALDSSCSLTTNFSLGSSYSRFYFSPCSDPGFTSGSDIYVHLEYSVSHTNTSYASSVWIPFLYNPDSNYIFNNPSIYLRSNNATQTGFIDFVITSFPSNTTMVLRSVNGSVTGSATFTVSFSDVPPSSGSTEPCPVCPVVPENPYDQKLDNITKAIYVCGAILIMLYFFFCIYKIIVKDGGSR